MNVLLILILLLAAPLLAIADDPGSTAEQETLKLRIKELELRKQILELESKKSERQPQQLTPSQPYQTPIRGDYAPPTSQPSSGSGYIRGPRGGCYTFTKSGRKRYVDRSMCD